MIEGIKINPQKIISMNDGDIMHAMKASDQSFIDFGEAYFSMIRPKTIKAWKMHLSMTLNIVVPIGKVRFVMIPDSSNLNNISNYQEVILSRDNYCRLTVPPKIWFGFMGLSKLKNLLLNLSDITHDKNEMRKKEITEFNYRWSEV